MTQNVSGTEAYTNDINNNFAAAKTAIANCAPISLVQTVNGKVNVSDIASTVNAQSTNAVPVGAKLFYDELAQKAASNHTHSQYLTEHQSLANYYNKSETNSAISTAIGNADHLKRSIVTVLPSATDAEANTIYMILKANGSGNNIYDEYLKTNGVLEKIGDTEVDLSGYAKTSSLSAVATSGSYNDLTNKPTLFSGSYNDLTNKPTIPDAQIQSDWNQTTTTAKDYIKNKPSIPAATTESTVSGWGFTKNSGTVQSVNGSTPDANGDVTITIPTVPTIATTVNSSSTNAQTVGAKLFYDTVGDIESVLDAIIAGT